MSKFNIELDESFISKIFELTDALPPAENEINLQVLKKQLYDIGVNIQNLKNEIGESKKTHYKPAGKKVQKDVVSNASEPVIKLQESSDVVQSTQPVPKNYTSSSIQFLDASNHHKLSHKVYDDDGNPVKGRVLIVDDLGVITYQLSIIFKKDGYLPVTSKEIFEAIDKFKRSSFDYVIMDLFIPTEREGFILLDELKKISKMRKEDTIVGVMSASTRKEHKQMCEKKGAAFYIEKADDWQNELFKLIKQYDS